MPHRPAARGYSLFSQRIILISILLLSLFSLSCLCVYIPLQIHTKAGGVCCVYRHVPGRAPSNPARRLRRTGGRPPPFFFLSARVNVARRRLSSTKRGKSCHGYKRIYLYDGSSASVSFILYIEREREIEVSSLCLLQLQCHGIIRGAKDGQPPFLILAFP